jgi:RHS repeat-associated protein
VVAIYAVVEPVYFTYDLAGQQAAQVDALAYVTYFYYDVLGRQYAVRDAADGLVYYQYDALGRRVSLVDQRGYASYFAYDAASRLVSELDPLGNATYYQYAGDGSLIARTDARGQTAYFEYDAVGRQAMAIYAAVEPVYFSHDLAGNRTRMQDEWGATYWDYDALGRPTRRHDPRGTVVTYAYGPGGQRTQLGVEGQGTVYYEYGPAGNMDWLLDGKTGLFTYYDYDPAQLVTRQQHPNGTTTYFIHDLAGRLSEKVTKKDSDASVLVRFAYARDSAGNPIAIEREPALGAFYYQYDQLQRLGYEGQFVDAARQYENYYEYDAAGNRTLLRHGETDAENLTYYTYNGANELTELHDAAGWTYFDYDPNGNTVMEQAPSYTRYFDWDGRDMLTGVRSTEQGWTDNVYRYDGLASRVSTLESGGLTYYDWDSINVIQEKDADGDVTNRQVHGHAPVFSVGDIALMDKSGTPYVPVSDQVGTTWNLLDSSASKANSYAYDAFGVARSVSETVSNLCRLGTKRLGVDSGLYHFIARHYRAAAGRFLSRDPVSRFSRMPGYCFGGDGPLVYVDPSGMWAFWTHHSITLNAENSWRREVWQCTDPAGVTRDCYDEVAEALADASKHEPPNDYEGHYLRPVDPNNKNVPVYNQKYRDFWMDHVASFETVVERARRESSSRTPCADCREALTPEVLGNAVHAWEDYFAHAVLWGNPPGRRRDGYAAPAWTAGRAGTPSRMSPKLKPASLQSFHLGSSNPCGEHPCLSEPPSGGEEKARVAAATDYVARALLGYVRDWTLACCCCCPVAEAPLPWWAHFIILA